MTSLFFRVIIACMAVAVFLGIGNSPAAYAAAPNPEDPGDGFEPPAVLSASAGHDRTFSHSVWLPLVALPNSQSNGEGSNGPMSQEGDSLFSLASAAATAELCHDSKGPGMVVQGTIGTASDSVFAGVLNVRVDNVPKQAFCTSIYNTTPFLPGQCFQNSLTSQPTPEVACTLRYYPPESGLDSVEAAARQSVIWQYLHGFEPTTSGVRERYMEILADVNAKMSSGLCSATPNPSIEISPSSAQNVLSPDNEGFSPSSHDFTITVLDNGQPVANQQVTVSTDLGVLRAYPKNRECGTLEIAPWDRGGN